VLVLVWHVVHRSAFYCCRHCHSSQAIHVILDIVVVDVIIVLQALSGYNTLLLGSYGRQLLFYPLEQLFATMAAAWADDGVRLFELSALAQTETRQFPTPIYGLVQGDVTADGVPNLMVLTHDGLHVLEVWHLSRQLAAACLLCQVCLLALAVMLRSPLAQVRAQTVQARLAELVGAADVPKDSIDSIDNRDNRDNRDNCDND